MTDDERADLEKRARVLFGPVTGGHYCQTCKAHTMTAADVLQLRDDGVRTIAVFYHCTTCNQPLREEI